VSELNELIASSSVHAFNSGLEQGKQLERERIFKLLDELGWIDMKADDLMALIKGEQK